MKALFALAVLLAAVPAVQAQKEKVEEGILRSSDELKDRFKGVGKGAKPAGNPAQGAQADGGVSIAELETLLQKDPDCRQDPADVKDLDKDLKGKFSLVTCTNKNDGVRVRVLVPKASAASQQIVYGSVHANGQLYRLNRGRLFSHYVVIEFDRQVQYLDLNKLDNGGFAMAGFLEDRRTGQFDDDAAFADALRRYMGIDPSSSDAKAADQLAERVKAEIGDKPHRLNASIARGELIIVANHSGNTSTLIWPKKTK